MADREKVYFVNGGKYTKKQMVKKGIEQCFMSMADDGYDTQCADCPYFDPDVSVESCKEELRQDALALLKEQEHKDKMFHALEDDWKRLKELLKEQEAVSIEWKCGFPHCPVCGQMLPEGDAVKYCLHCGKAVKWHENLLR